MIQQQRGQLPVNCRKQARTSTLNTSNRGVDVHSFNQPTNNTIQHLTSSNSKNMFSNIQFSPFSNNTSDEPNHKISLTIKLAHKIFYPTVNWLKNIYQQVSQLIII